MLREFTDLQGKVQRLNRPGFRRHLATSNYRLCEVGFEHEALLR